MSDERIGLDEALYRIDQAGLAIIPCSLPTGGDDFDEGWVLVEYQEYMEFINPEKIIRQDTDLRNLILRYANND